MATIELLVPALATAAAGNSVTANRYCAMFGALGHDAVLVPAPTGQADLVVALNAYRSAAGISDAATAGTPIVVVLTGTDVYRFLHSDTEIVRASLGHADWLVGLNHRIGNALTEGERRKLTVIREGAARSCLVRQPSLSGFSIAVVGHLRDEKDPAIVLRAINGLPASFPFVVNVYGAAHSDSWARWAQRAAKTDNRYVWHGPVERSVLDGVYATSHLLLNSSLIEGGANVLSEAVMAGLPVLASGIDGNIGVLGDNYPGYFRAGDADELQQALHQIMSKPERLDRMTDAVVALQPEFGESVEQRRWADLLNDMGF